MKVVENYPEIKHRGKTLHRRTLSPMHELIGSNCLHKIDFIQSVVIYSIKKSKVLSGF